MKVVCLNTPGHVQHLIFECRNCKDKMLEVRITACCDKDNEMLNNWIQNVLSIFSMSWHLLHHTIFFYDGAPSRGREAWHSERRARGHAAARGHAWVGRLGRASGSGREWHVAHRWVVAAGRRKLGFEWVALMSVDWLYESKKLESVLAKIYRKMKENTRASYAWINPERSAGPPEHGPIAQHQRSN